MIWGFLFEAPVYQRHLQYQKYLTVMIMSGVVVVVMGKSVRVTANI